MVEARLNTDGDEMEAWINRQLLAAVKRGDYGLLKALAWRMDIPQVGGVIQRLLDGLMPGVYEIMRLQGMDPESARPLPRRPGAPLRDRGRMHAKLMFRAGVAYRDAVIAIWWCEAPYDLKELRRRARRAGKQTVDGARRWLRGQGSKHRSSLSRAWQDVHSNPPPRLDGFIPLSTLCLSAWPPDMLLSVRATPR